MYVKTITPAFEQIGKRKRLSGYLAELHDGNILLYSCEYDTNSQAEKVLDALVFELLTDLADQGLVDDVPAALEAEHVSSTHLPSWQAAAPIPTCLADDCIQTATHYDEYCCYHYSEQVGSPCDCTDDDYEDAMWEGAHDSYNGQVPDVEFAPVGWAA